MGLQSWGSVFQARELATAGDLHEMYSFESDSNLHSPDKVTEWNAKSHEDQVPEGRRFHAKVS